MKTASIKRGSIVEILVPVKSYRKEHPPGTQCQVLRLIRKDGKAVVSFKDSYSNSTVSLTEIKPVNQSNRKVPKVGDLFNSSWGYEQTNIDFYQVVRVISENTIEVRSCAGKQVSYQNLSGQVKADKGNLSGDPKMYRVLYDMNGNPSFKVASYARAFPTNENEEHFFSEWH